MKVFKRSGILTVALVLFLALILPVLASCGGGNNPQGTSPSKETVQVIEKDEYGRPVLDCDVVSANLNYEYAPITILAMEDRKYETYDSTVAAGDTMNEALYARNMYVESAIKVEIGYDYCVNSSANKTMMNKVKSVYLGGATGTLYDIILPHAYYSTPFALEGMYTNLLNCDHLDFSRPWWNGTMNEEMTVNNQLYIGIGDFSLSAIRNTFCMFYSKDLLKMYGRDINIYEIVDDGAWTLEYLETLIKDIYGDIDEIPGESEGDRYGLVTSNHAFNADAFLAGFNVKLTTRNEANGVLDIGFGDDRSVAAFESTYDLVHMNETYFVTEKNGYEKVRNMFVSNQAVFVADMFCMTDTIAQNMTGYGIVPVPLLNADQKDYKSTSQEGFSALIIPANIQGDELDRTTAALECLCYASYNKIVPLYFEKILKVRYSPLLEDSQMYDLILASRYYNFGYVYSRSIENMLWSWRNNIGAESINISAYWNEENGSVYADKLGTLLEFFYPEGVPQ